MNKKFIWLNNLYSSLNFTILELLSIIGFLGYLIYLILSVA